MIFLYIAIAWIALLVLFVVVWARFGSRRRRLSDAIERDRRRARDLHVVGQDEDQTHRPGDAA
jgi:hypothetical protein